MKKIICTAIEAQIEAFSETPTTIELEISGRKMTIDRRLLLDNTVNKATLAEVILQHYLVFE